MLKKFTVKNYKNFKDEISLDFSKIAGYQFNKDCLSMGLIGKMLIYGRNATGKTNFGRALLDIERLMYDMSRNGEKSVLINADSRDDTAKFIYEFKFGNDEVIYKYSRFANAELCDEELSINGNVIFKCDFKNNKFDFQGLNIISAETVNTNRYLIQDNDVLSFLRWLINNTSFSYNSVLIKLSEYVNKMDLITVGNNRIESSTIDYSKFFEDLKNPVHLQNFEDFLNLMGIECKLVLKELPDGQVELYFDHKKLVPFYSTASSGTLALTNLYQKIVSKAVEYSLVYLDEFDAFYHYEMAEKLISFFKTKYPKCQFIMTSHNTNLMTNKIMRPDCLFILSSRGTLTALCDATERELREGHNLEKMYISGEFEKYE
ncbi:ATP-binding protein [Holdemanella biformis]|uniref:AAA family ATPase n=1 Tax=Holdemanella biformis TaxID=1735 RepID=UPI00307B0D40